jgi:hypothetical protein
LILDIEIFHTIVYSGFSHFCFWQCSESIFTGNFPVHDAPPINFLTSGLFGASPSRSGPFWPEVPAADAVDFFGLGSLSEFEKTIKLSSAPVEAGEDLFAPCPPPGFPPFACPFFTIFNLNMMFSVVIHVATREAMMREVFGFVVEDF